MNEYNLFEQPLFNMIVRSQQINIKLKKIHQKQADELSSFVAILKVIAASKVQLRHVLVPGLLFE